MCVLYTKVDVCTGQESACMYCTIKYLEPGGLVRRGLAERPEGLETLPDAVDVGQVHEEDLGVGVVLRALHPAATGPVSHCCRVAAGVDY